VLDSALQMLLTSRVAFCFCFCCADPNDVLVRAVPSANVRSFIDNAWIHFVNDFNTRARVVRKDSIGATCGSALQFLAVRSMSACVVAPRSS
jgi:hypothetical protein